MTEDEEEKGKETTLSKRGRGGGGVKKIHPRARRKGALKREVCREKEEEEESINLGRVRHTSEYNELLK